MNVASKELCEELYEVSGWERYADERQIAVISYDLGYLWRKFEDMGNDIAVGYDDSGAYYHFHWGNRGTGHMMEGFGESFSAEPADIEDSLCQLFIQLFRNGVLTKENL